MTDKIKESPEKWIVSSYDWNKAIEKITSAEVEYGYAAFLRGDVTARTAQKELWQRVAEHYGFNVSFGEEK